MDQLVKSAQDGDKEALARLEERHRRTVWNTSLLMLKRFRALPRDDAVQAGFLGFMQAVKKYDHNRGANFNTFLIYCVRVAVKMEAQYTSLIVRVPVYRWNKDEEAVSRSLAISELLDVADNQDGEPEFDELDAVRLHKALEPLSERELDILYNAYTRHTSMREIGKRHNISHEGVRNIYHRLLKRLKVQLLGECS